MPLVLRAPNGSAKQVGSQHSHAMEHFYAHIPGLKVLAPATPADAKGLLKSAIRDDNPVLFMESETLYNIKGEVPDDPDLLVPMGKANIVRPGKDVSIIAWSRMVHVALEAATELAKEGVEAEVVDVRSLRPLDEQTLVESVTRTHRAVVAHEGWPYGGVGAEIADRLQRLAFDELDAPILRATTLDVPMPYNAKLDVGKGDPWQGEMQHFIDCILNDQTPDPDATQGVTMMKMLDAIYKSAAIKREVVIE